MKKSLLFLLLLLSSKISFSQNEVPDTLVVFGADFSLAKIRTENNYSTQTILTNDIPRLNSEIIKICKQYSIRFRAKELIFDSIDVQKRNQELNPRELLTEERYMFSEGDNSVRNVVKKYNSLHHENGVGLLFVMEKIDEIDHRESFYIMMFDLDSKKIIHCEKVETGLSRVKDEFSSGWFSWKTGIFKVLSSMNDVYDFWDNYPENKPVDMRPLISEKIKNTTPLSVKKTDSIARRGIKNQKTIALHMAISMMNDNIQDGYVDAFYAKYNINNIYGVTGSSSLPKTNLSFDYGFAKRHSAGISFGIDKGTVVWADTVNSSAHFTDSWQRYQIAGRYNFYLVSIPKFHLFSGIQIGYNYYKRTSNKISENIVSVNPLPLSAELNIGLAIFIKKHYMIKAVGGAGFGAPDYFSIGLGYRF